MWIIEAAYLIELRCTKPRQTDNGSYGYPEVQEKLSRHIDEPMNTELIFGDDFWKETCWMPPCETQFFEPGDVEHSRHESAFCVKVGYCRFISK